MTFHKNDQFSCVCRVYFSGEDLKDFGLPVLDLTLSIGGSLCFFILYG
jgi:hypothetical protein